MSSPTTVDSQEVRELAPGEIVKMSAWLGQSLYGATIASVVGITQTSGESTLIMPTTLSARGAINTSGAVTVDGVERPINTVIQYVVTVPSNAALGDYVVTVTYTTSVGDTKKFRCRLRIV
jgi:hypothetical protein